MSSPRFLFGVTSVAVIIAGGVLFSGSAASAVPVSDITVGASPIGVALSPDGVNAYVSNSDGSVSKINTATNVMTSIMGVGTASPYAAGQGPYGIAVSPNGALVYVTLNGDNSIAVIDTTNDSVTHPAGFTNAFTGPYSVVFSPDSLNAYVTNADGNSVSVLDTANNTVVGSPISVGSSPWGIALSPTGARAYVTNTSDGTVSVIDTTNKTVLFTIRTSTNAVGSYTSGQGALGVTVSPNGAFVYVTNNQDNTVSVIDPTEPNPHVIYTYPTAFNASSSFAGPYAVAFSPDSATAYITNNDGGTVFVIDATTHALTDIITVGTNPYGIVLNGSGIRGYVVNTGSNSVSVLTLTVAPIVIAPEPTLAVTGISSGVFALAGGGAFLLILVGLIAIRTRSRTRSRIRQN